MTKIKFLEEITAIILSQRRVIALFGVAGGEDGKVGNNYPLIPFKFIIKLRVVVSFDQYFDN